MVGAPQSMDRVCQTFVANASVSGAAFTVMTSDAHRDMLCASDEVIASVEELQFRLGAGPGLDAFTTGRPVLIPDLSAHNMANRWPVLVAELAGLPVAGLFALPMQIGAITVGVCTAYRSRSEPLTPAELRPLLSAVDAATVTLVMIRAGQLEDDLHLQVDGNGAHRQRVHQATGMLIAQLGVGAEEAFARLRAHAYAEGRTMDEVADDIVARRLRLEGGSL